MKVRKAVITAAGLGTRFLPLTKSMPKEMLPLVGKPLIQYSVEEAFACGVETIIIVTAPHNKAIRDYFSRSPELEQTLNDKGDSWLAEHLHRLSDMGDIRFVEQRKPLGLGHAVLAAAQEVGNEPFMLLLPDDLFERGESPLKQMLDVSEQHGGSVVAVKRMNAAQVVRYGVIKPQEIGNHTFRVMGMVEKPCAADAPSDLAIMGRYVLTPEVLDILKGAGPGAKGEIQLTDALQKLLTVQPVHAYEFEGERYDVGTLQGWLETTVALALKDPEYGPRLTEYIDKLLQQRMARRQ